jgi:multiple sugar transport system permease protein
MRLDVRGGQKQGSSPFFEGAGEGAAPEKGPKKHFSIEAWRGRRRVQSGQKFFASFFQKRRRSLAFWIYVVRKRLAGTYLALLAASAVVLFPLYWVVITSLKLPREIYRVPALWPQVFTWNNYRILLDQKGFLANIANSFYVAGSVTVIALVISSLAAYSLARFRTRFRGLIGRLILFAYLTPTSLLFIPISILMAELGLGNSLRGLILVYLAFSLPVATWLLQGYFRAIPRELEEQGMIDGLSRLGTLFRIVLPLSAPGLAAVAIFTFTGAWNELLLALVLITSESQRTAPLALNYLITSDVLPWGPLMAGAVLSALPLVVLYFVAQRFMVDGMTAGSVKG